MSVINALERTAACMLDPWYKIIDVDGYPAIRVHELPLEMHGHHHADVLMWLYENDSQRLADLFEEFIMNNTTRQDRRTQIVDLFQRNVAEHVLKDGVDVSVFKPRFKFCAYSRRGFPKSYTTYLEITRDERIISQGSRPHFTVAKTPRFHYRSPYWTFHVFYGQLKNVRTLIYPRRGPKQPPIRITCSEKFLELFGTPRSDIHV